LKFCSFLRAPLHLWQALLFFLPCSSQIWQIVRFSCSPPVSLSCKFVLTTLPHFFKSPFLSIFFTSVLTAFLLLLFFSYRLSPCHKMPIATEYSVNLLYVDVKGECAEMPPDGRFYHFWLLSKPSCLPRAVYFGALGLKQPLQTGFQTQNGLNRWRSPYC
jgi:hypothetical protein